MNADTHDSYSQRNELLTAIRDFYWWLRKHEGKVRVPRTAGRDAWELCHQTEPVMADSGSPDPRYYDGPLPETQSVPDVDIHYLALLPDGELIDADGEPVARYHCQDDCASAEAVRVEQVDPDRLPPHYYLPLIRQAIARFIEQSGIRD